ncbi:hypothetical protein N867_07510 [Actinotalea fermentans ATCC 43279 = JCM 9966 = DSM 3133]|uniref:Lipoprotein n=2 Tax=Actinotalea fermentans TaxID=43671 RepID=A0A511Z171_9CELL|nr:hypothetical protein N867_07510 [Actinotalea fermentans ATCC 43279 = JCM 9966 = DSM 3133]GEN81198.1 hypothetical protein AFE02nite_29320 [Actinotalea fermentans]
MAALAVVGLALLALAGCTGDDEPAASPSPTAPASAEPTPEPPESPSAEPSAEATAEETPAATGIVLDAAGVGGIAMGTPDPRAALEALLGPAEQETNDVACGPGDVDALSWGALSVSTLEGALWGWDINPHRGALSADVVVASGVTPYQPLSDALALPGATTPQYLASLDMLYVEAGGVQFYGSGSDAATSQVELTGVNVITCG